MEEKDIAIKTRRENMLTKEEISQECQTGFCGGYKNCDLSSKSFDTKDKDCRECIVDATVAVLTSLTVSI